MSAAARKSDGGIRLSRAQGASADNTYFELGGEYALGPVTLRYNVSHANYADLKVYE